MREIKQPKARTEDLVVQELADETLIYDLKTNKAYCLNQTARTVWNNCDGAKDASQIAAALKKEFKSPVDENLIWLALNELQKFDLLIETQSQPAEMKGMSRREMIRRVGITSMIALPLVTAVVFPTSTVLAGPASCVNVVCNSPADCGAPRTCTTCSNDPDPRNPGFCNS